MKRKTILDYVAVFLLCALLAMQTATITDLLMASDGVSISDLLNSDENEAQQPASSDTQASANNDSATNASNDSNLINDLANNMDYSHVDSDVVKKTSGTLNYWAGVIIQILAYFITAAMAISKVLDLAYIGIPVLRKFLANGYMGNAAAAGTPADANNMMGAGGMGMGRYGGMGGMGMGRYGGGMMGAGGMGMSGMPGQGGMDASMAMQNQPARGRLQLVSNAALNAVATESVLGTDGKGQSAFKTYWSDMVISIIVTAILITLALTGVMSKLGFMIGDFIARFVGGINI